MKRTLLAWLVLLPLMISCVGGASVPQSSSAGKIVTLVDTVNPLDIPHAMGETAIYVFPIGAGEYPLAIGEEAQWSGWSCPRWSPDSSRLVVFEWETLTGPYGPYGYEGYLNVVNADGSAPLRLTAANSCASWSPDGRKLLFSAHSDLFVIDVASRAQTALTPSSTSWFQSGWSAEWSPDGTRILYSTRDAIYEMNTDGTDTTRLIGPCGKECAFGAPRYSPDGQWILFTSSQGRGGIYRMKRDGSEVTWLHSGGSAVWSPDGHRIAFVDNPDDGIQVMNADGSEVATLVGGQQWHFYDFDWGP